MKFPAVFFRVLQQESAWTLLPNKEKNVFPRIFFLPYLTDSEKELKKNSVYNRLTAVPPSVQLTVVQYGPAQPSID